MKKFFVILALLATSSFAQVDSDATKHYKDGEKHALMAVGFLAGGMVMVPIEEYACKKFGVGPKTETVIKVLSGLAFGSASLYFAGQSAHDFYWVGYKTSRDF
jgi:hypothetical protein